MIVYAQSVQKELCLDYTLKQGKMVHPVLKLKKPVEGFLGIKCLVKTWTAHLCVWIILVMVQKVGLRLYGYAFELSSWSKYWTF